MDLAGHERYFKTTAYGLTGHLPGARYCAAACMLSWRLGCHAAMPCHAMPCHVLSCCNKCRAMPCHALLCHVMPCLAVLCHAHALLCHAVPRAAMPHQTCCHAAPCLVMPCHAMPWCCILLLPPRKHMAGRPTEPLLTLPALPRRLCMPHCGRKRGRGGHVQGAPGRGACAQGQLSGGQSCMACWR